MVVKSIKARTVYVYLDSEGQRRRWDKLAAKAGVSLSEFVAAMVEEQVREAEDPDFRPRGAVLKEMESLKEANAKLLEERKMREALVEKLEAEVRRYRAEAFLEGEKGGMRKYDRDLIEVLRTSGTVQHEELLRRLKVKATDAVAVKAVGAQLEGLQRYGLVKPTPRGWRWSA